jgi:hypothetical protein
LAFLEAIDAAEADPFSAVGAQDFDSVAGDDSDDLAGEVSGSNWSPEEQER